MFASGVVLIPLVVVLKINHKIRITNSQHRCVNKPLLQEYILLTCDLYYGKAPIKWLIPFDYCPTKAIMYFRQSISSGNMELPRFNFLIPGKNCWHPSGITSSGERARTTITALLSSTSGVLTPAHSNILYNRSERIEFCRRIRICYAVWALKKILTSTF